MPLTNDEILETYKNMESDPSWSSLAKRPLRTGDIIHKYHRYPTRFMPQLVERILDEFAVGRGTYVNDPFMGCGTTLVSALAMGATVSGTDINPVANLITKVKTTPIDIDYLSSTMNRFRVYWKLMKDDLIPYIPCNHFDYISEWFSEEVRDELGKIYTLINMEAFDDVRDFFLVCFSHILRECSLWKTKSIKPTKDLNKKVSDPYEIFRKHLLKMKKGNDMMYYVCQPYPDYNKYVHASAKDAKYQINYDDQVDLVLTSSPYGTNLDYCGLSFLSLAWLNLVDDLKEFRKTFIGTPYGKGGIRSVDSDMAMELIRKIDDQDRRSAGMLSYFFSRMENVFKESYRIVKSNGRCVYVVSNTYLKGVEVNCAEIFTDYFQRTGFEIERIIKRGFNRVSLPRRRIEYVAGNETGLPSEYIIVGRKG